MTSILVTGARGKTGREVAAQLGERPELDVRGGSSEPTAVRIRGVTPVRFDWLEPQTWTAALDGVSAVYVARPEIEDAPERIAALLRPELDRVVLLSELGAEDLPAASWERRAEQAVIDAGVAWTILRCAWFAQVLTDERYFLAAIRDQGELELPTDGAGVSFVDSRDVAAVAVAALLEGSRHAGRAYDLTGPRALTIPEVAERLTDAAGHPVKPVDPPLERAVAALADAGLEPWFVSYARGVYERVRAGVHARTTDDVARVSGSIARTLDAFVAEHAAAWRR